MSFDDLRHLDTHDNIRIYKDRFVAPNTTLCSDRRKRQLKESLNFFLNFLKNYRNVYKHDDFFEYTSDWLCPGMITFHPEVKYNDYSYTIRIVSRKKLAEGEDTTQCIFHLCCHETDMRRLIGEDNSTMIKRISSKMY